MDNIQNQEIAKKSHLPKNKKFFWLFFIFGIGFAVLGTSLIPVWAGTNLPWESLGNDFFSLIFSLIILVYIVGYLFKRIALEKKVAVKILTVFEAGFFSAIAIGSIMEQYDMVSVAGPCTILGAALWLRGFVYIVKAYLCKHDESDRYPLWMLIVSVGLVTLGSVMITKNIFEVYHILWATGVILIITGIILFVLGFVSKPKVDKALKKLKKQQKIQKREEKALKKQEKKTFKSQEKTAKLEGKIEKKGENEGEALPQLEGPKNEESNN